MPKWKNVLTTSEELHRLKRSAVLRESTRIISKKGFANTSLEDIAAALHVSKGTLYNYIKDKHEILFECHKMALDVGDQAFAFGDANGRSGYGKLRLMLRAYLTWLNGAMGGCGVASEVTGLRPSDRPAIIARRDAVDARLVAYIEEGIKDGTIRRVDPKLATFSIMGTVNAVQSWYSPKGRLSAEAIADGVVDILMTGIMGVNDPDHVDLAIPAYGSVAVDTGKPIKQRARRTVAGTDTGKPDSTVTTAPAVAATGKGARRTG